MNKQVLVLVCALVATQVVNAYNLGDIIDEAYEQLDKLTEIVKGDITVAHDDLHGAGEDFIVYSNQVVTNGEVELQQEHESIMASVLSLKELALQANEDITVCTQIREEYLNKLPEQFGHQILQCTVGRINETQKIIQDASYIVDVSINKVHELEHQLHRCGSTTESFLCIQPILSEIQLDMIRLPQDIKTEVTATKSIVETLKVSVDSCSSVKVSEYTSDANSILEDMTACVNRILNN